MRLAQIAIKTHLAVKVVVVLLGLTQRASKEELTKEVIEIDRPK